MGKNFGEISIKCPFCGKQIKVNLPKSGKEVICPNCKKGIEVKNPKVVENAKAQQEKLKKISKEKILINIG